MGSCIEQIFAPSLFGISLGGCAGTVVVVAAVVVVVVVVVTATVFSYL